MGGREYLGEFEQVVLWALVRRPERGYGGGLHDEILETTGRDVSIPSVYVTLKRLEKKGLVSSSVGPLSPGARETRNYRIEPAGRAALERSRRLLERLWDGAEAQPGTESGA